MVELKKFASKWISRSNINEFKGKIAVIQDVRPENGMYGESLVAQIKIVDGDYPILRMRLNSLTIRRLTEQGIKDSDELIGRKVRITEAEFRGMIVPSIELVEDGEGIGHEVRESPRTIKTK